MQIRKFASRLKTEFQSRRTRNPRYSLRAFAAFLGADHSTLSQVIRGKRPVPVASIRAWGKKLALDREETLAYIAAEQMQGLRTAARQHHLKHWTAEAMAILSQPVHWKMLGLCRKPEFHADSRHVAASLGVTTDEVNLALSRLLRLRLLNVSPSGTWSDATGVSNLTEDSFRKLALARVREHASDMTLAERPFRAA
jgi:transcriptional regulator with XRE-family HTH domain